MAKVSEVFVGCVFGRLTVESIYSEFSLKSKRNFKYVSAKCSCGKQVRVKIGSLGSDTFSCGCKTRERLVALGAKHITHGMSKTKTHIAWCAMWGRCTNPNNASYALYKDRVPPERWKVFENFLEDMGIAPDGYSLERVDNSKPFSPENCKWIPIADQHSNTSRVRRVTDGKEVLPLAQAAKKLGLDYFKVYYKVCTKLLPVAEVLGSEWSFVSEKHNG
jgi:hypothetical protein